MSPSWRFAKITLYFIFVVGGLLPSVIVTQSPAHATVIRVDGAIDPNQTRHLKRGLYQAREQGSALVIVEINTHGGQVSAMRSMVEAILVSEIPVITYVTPPGAQATSAGAFISAAGSIAAMAPATNIGASSPVSGSGLDLPPTLASKATSDAAALMRSIAKERSRNALKLEEMVTKAASFTAAEALALDIVDLVAPDIDTLIAQLDGVTLRVRSGEFTLRTQGISCLPPLQSCKPVAKSALDRFLTSISDPNIAGLLLMVGGAGLFIEFLSPGLIFPGVFGVIFLVLAFAALGNLPVNWAGAALILFAVVLFLLEFHVPGFGIFGVGGIISFMFGAFFLFSPFSPPPISISGPRVHLSPWLIGVTTGGLTAGVAGTVYLAWRDKRIAPVLPPPNALVGQYARVTKMLDPEGEVYGAGESWSAEAVAGEPIPLGETVEILGLEGLRLRVRKIPKQD